MYIHLNNIHDDETKTKIYHLLSTVVSKREYINKFNAGIQHETRMDQVYLMHEYAFSY